MDEALRARLIGAAVLVALAVLLIPELLSGRKAVEPVVEEGVGPRGNRTFTIELGTDTSPATRTPTTVTGAPGPSPAPVGPAAATQTQDGSAAQPTQESIGQKVVPDSATRPEPRRSLADELVEPQATAATSAAPSATPPMVASPADRPTTDARSGGWAVQVGAFGSAETAGRLVRELSGAGFEAYVSPIVRDGKTLHRVRVGPEADRAAAERSVPRLKARGLPATVVQND
jgi:DedD protein